MTNPIRLRLRPLLSLAATLGLLIVLRAPLPRLGAQMTNPIPAENQLPGNPQSEWDVSGSGDSTIQGFSTDISVNKGGSIGFKVNTPASTFHINIYRLGYYQGNGARKVGTITGVPGKTQPACLTDSTTLLYDCGNWSLSTTWNVPSTLVSGIYIAKIIRDDTGGASHIPFVVRDDALQADILLQTDDTTWEAYNQYGGWSLYLGTPNRAYKVSYNRPYADRAQSAGYGMPNYVFYAEYPMARFLEQNGYFVKYWSGIDTDRYGSQLTGSTRPKVFLTVGHDEYWSGTQRANVEAARAAGINLALFTGNDTFWKTRYENSIDGSNTPYRTLVTYKETHDNKTEDPLDPPTWTGTWRDPRFSPPADGGRPENGLSGTIFTVNSGTVQMMVPAAYAPLRFWRNTSVATLSPGQTEPLGVDTVGYEWNEDLDNGSRPPGLIDMSQTVAAVSERVTDFGSTYLPATATHSLTLYRHSSGALVFSAGTVQWVFGLDTHHDIAMDAGPTAPDPNMQQATVNLLADMGVQPATLQSPMIAATASSDFSPPSSTITSPAVGASIAAETLVSVSGTAVDAGGGVVGGVEVSVDGGATWHPAIGTANWSYTWVPGVLGTATIMSRATDDSGNIEATGPSEQITVTQATCPCSLLSPSPVTPFAIDANDGSATEVGMKFYTDVGGYVNGVRFYKASNNTGTHVGHLWTSSGTALATVTFTNESGSGWQQANFSSPVAIQANTEYVISYFAPKGHYSDDEYYFGKASKDQWPLHGEKSTTADPNAVYMYGSSGGFPYLPWFADNYWVDVVFTPDLVPPAVSLTAPANNANISGTSVTVSANASDSAGLTGVQFMIDGAPLGSQDMTSPYAIIWNSTLTANGTHTLTAVATNVFGNKTTSAPVTVSVFNADTIPPTVSIATPANGATVSGSFSPISINATDNQGVASVQPLIDGVASGPALTSPPYKTTFDTTVYANNSTHTIAARATDTSNNVATSAASTVTVLNPVSGAPAVDAVASTDNASASSTVQSPAFSTSAGNELLLAFVASDASTTPNTTVTGVTGGGLTWVLVGRANTESGTSEIWRAFSAAALTNAQVTATLSQSVVATLEVISFSNVNTSGTNGSGAIGNVAANSKSSGAPTASVTTTAANSWVFGVGNDWDSAISRTAASGQVVMHQYLAPTGDTFWIQRTLAPTPASGTSVTINDTAPTGDEFNLFICEIKASNVDTTPPTVSITSPTAGASLTGTVTVTANASDNVSVAGVQFQLDGANLGAEVTAAPFQLSWNTTTTTNGSHTLTAIARDPSGNKTTSAGVTVFVDTTPPTVAFTAPPPGNVSGTVTVAASASDNVGVVGVQFQLDGANLGAEVTAAPYQVSWNTGTSSNGSHTLTAIARDAAGNKTTATMTVTVNNVDSTPPTVSITGPTGGTVSGTVTVTASASDNVGVVSVQFMLDGAALGNPDTTAPYAIAWNTTTASNGSHQLSAVARDGAGNTGTAVPVTVTVLNDTTPPTVSITAPSNNATVTGSTAITASASDNVAVASVQFLLDGAALGSPITASPYTLTWDSTTVANGSHAISAKAVDTSGNQATSAAVSVTVSNAAPVAVAIDTTTSFDSGALSTTATTNAFSTAGTNELLLAFVSTDGPSSGSNTTVTSVTGGGLTWQLVKRTNVQFGTSEVWSAFAASKLTNATVTVNLSKSVVMTISVVAFTNVDTTGTNGSGAIGATASANAASGAPTATLTTTRANSWVFGVGNDWDAATARTLGANQTMVHQYLAPTGDTLWVQRMSAPTPINGTNVTINDTAPSTDRYNLTICEILPRLGTDSTPPTVAMTAPAAGSTVSGASVTVSANASDNVAVASVQFTLDGASLGAPVTSAPYSIIWNSATTTNGTHLLGAVATDTSGNTATATAVSVTVNNVDTTPPTVSMTAPANNATVSGSSVTVSASASDNVGVASVQFLVDGTALGAPVTSAPYTIAWNTTGAANGSHTLAATAQDLSGNVATSAPITVTVSNTSLTSLGDTTVADFSAGTPDASTYISMTNDGEVILAPTVGQEFSTTSLPSGWFSTAWATGGVSTFNGSTLTVDGTRVGTNTLYGPGRSIEFVATFSGAANQNVGFGVDFNTQPWAAFGTTSAGTLLARSRTGGNQTNTTISGSWFTGPHRFRIDWNTSTIVFYIDGAQVASHTRSITASMRPLASDQTVGGGGVTVDWMRMTPYAASSTFLSRVFDGGAATSWSTLSWTSTLPAGTSLTMSVRTGNTAVPDASWSAFTTVAASGGAIGATSRYIQYRAQLATTASGQTPVLSDVTISTSTSSGSGLTVSGVSPASGPAAGGTALTLTGTNFVPGGFNADVYIGMNGAPIGTTLTPTILSNGTIGVYGGWNANSSPLTGFTVGPHLVNRAGPVTVGGVVYPTNYASESLALDHAHSFTTASIWPNPGYRQATVAGFVTFGPPQAASGSLFDYMGVFGEVTGGYAMMQLLNGTGTSYALNIESSNGGTHHSAYISITPGSTYWCALNANLNAGTASLNVYEISGWTLVGSVTTTMSAGEDIGEFRFGNNEEGTAAGATSYFENLVIDYSQAVFPLGPIGAPGSTVTIDGTPAAASVINATTIDAVTPAHAAGTVNVTVTNPGGQSFTLPGGFTYASMPALDLPIEDPPAATGGQPTGRATGPPGR